MSEKTIVSTLIERIKNNKIFALLIVVGIILIALANVTDAVDKLSKKTSGILGGKEKLNLDIVNKQLRPVYFSLEEVNPEITDEFGRHAVLGDDNLKILDDYVVIMKGLPEGYNLILEGHTSQRIYTVNRTLAESRLDVVTEYLEDSGIPANRIKKVNFSGEEFEQGENEYAERVEFEVLQIN